MDPSIRSLLPTHQLGSDGAEWWIGQVEEIDQPKKSNRFRVRIVGVHDADCENVKTEDLPWAHTALPVTVPYKTGGSSGASANLEEGDWVFGFWLNIEKTKPLILGSIGHTANSADSPPEDVISTTSEDKCLSFKVAVNPKTNPTADSSANAATNKNLASGQLAGNSQTTMSPADGAHAAENSAANPFGTQVCVSTAQAECNPDTKSELNHVLGELFKMVQDSSGNIGDYLVGKVNGELFKYTSKAQGYINKVLRIVKSALARVRGEIIAKLKEGIEYLVKLILTPFEGILEGVQEFLETTLEKIGCSIEDIYERLVDFITALIFDYLLKVFRAATCQVDIFVNAIINKITGFVSGLLDAVLGPLQAILGIAGGALNLVGGAMFKIMSILGISCGGIDSACGSEDTRCNKKKKDEVGDFLDGLLDGLENGPLDYGQSVCDDARSYAPPELAGGIIFGGLPDVPPGGGNSPIYPGPGDENPPGGSTLPPGETTPTDPPAEAITYEIKDTNVFEGDIAQVKVIRSGNIQASSSVTFQTYELSATKDVDYQDVSGILGFGPNQTERVISIQTYQDGEQDTPEDFEVAIEYSTGTQDVSFIQSTAIVTIGLKPDVDPNDPTPSTPPNIIVGPTPPSPPPGDGGTGDLEDDDPDPDAFIPEVIVAEEVSVIVKSDKTQVEEGEFITYTITTNGIPNDTILSYSLFGLNINQDDIIGGNLYGTFAIVNNQSTVVVGIREDAEIEGTETLVFTVNGTGAKTSVDINGQDESPVKPLVPSPPADHKPPTIGDIIVDDDGKIIDITIDDPGDPYLLPPHIAITGQGWGALAVPLLDSNGYVTEIRVTQRGRNFVPNKPDNINCVLDSLTLTRPGTGYTSIPTVYINGDSSLVTARINASGFVIGFDVLDRTQIFDNAPTVEIVGGGGFGAKALASLSCLDSDTRDLLGYAKIGTGRYVDCPS
jgi:hypothetical protein